MEDFPRVFVVSADVTWLNPSTYLFRNYDVEASEAGATYAGTSGASVRDAIRATGGKQARPSHPVATPC